MNLTEEQIAKLRWVLIENRRAYFLYLDKFGGDGAAHPEPHIEAAMHVLGMSWGGDPQDIMSGDAWSGNEQFRCGPGIIGWSPVV